MKKATLMIILLIVAGMAACGFINNKDFQETESGIKYYFHESGGTEKAVIGDILSLNMTYSIEDSLLFDNRDMGTPVYLPMMDSQFPGDIYECLSMMAVGDSATFIINAAEFFLLTAGMMEVPPFVEEDSEMVFNIKLLQAMDEEAYFLEEQRMMEEQMAEDLLRAEQEEDLMLEYLAVEGITVEPTTSGLYFIEKDRGEGPKVESGNMVSVHYEGRLIDGTVFDSSYDRGEPLEFVVGEGWVIPGWDEGISMMHVGGKATLVIPSHLGYGDRGAGPLIPAYSTLVFDVEVVDAQSNE